MAEASLGSPSAVRNCDGAEEIAIEAVVAAMMRDIIFDGLVRQPHDGAKAGLDRLSRAEAGKRFGRPSAAHHIIDGRTLTETQAQNLNVGDELRISVSFGVCQQRRQRSTAKL